MLLPRSPFKVPIWHLEHSSRHAAEGPVPSDKYQENVEMLVVLYASHTEI